MSEWTPVASTSGGRDHLNAASRSVSYPLMPPCASASGVPRAAPPLRPAADDCVSRRRRVASCAATCLESRASNTEGADTLVAAWHDTQGPPPIEIHGDPDGHSATVQRPQGRL